MKKWYSSIEPKDLWNTYWNSTNFDDNLKLINGDQLESAYKRYLSQDQIILEAGCGLSKWVVSLSDRGYPVIGLDNHFPSLNLAKQNSRNLNLVNGTITEIPLPDNSIDVYISLGVVEHFEEGPQVPLAEAYRIIKPGGIAIVETPHNNFFRRGIINPLWDVLVIIRKLLGVKYYFSEYRYSASELHKFLKDAGFTILESHTKDYEQNNKSIGLYCDVPIVHQHEGDSFEINWLGQIIKTILNFISPWIISGCVYCVVEKP